MKLKPGPHPTLQQLSDFAQGKLGEAPMERIAQHIDGCDRCCQHIASTDEDRLIALARRAGQSDTLLDLNEKSGDTVSPSSNAGSLIAATVGAAGVPALEPDLSRLERYRVIDRIGSGGMGVVYRAEHKMMGREVALKVINRQLTRNLEAVSRFQNEVRAAAKLTHPNIVSSYDAENVGELHFLVMELVDGESLEQRVRREGPMYVEQAMDAVRDVALGLQAAFQLGMVHRDIKPSNLMIDTQGKIKILDFGLARFERQSFPDGEIDAGSAGLTGTNIAIGTPDYLSPEQAKSATDVDIRSDIYSLGCTLYFLLTGHGPFPDGDPMEKISKQMVSDPVDVRSLRADVPRPVAELLQKMMAKQPAQRFQTPAELVQGIDASRVSVATTPRKTKPVRPSSNARWSGRRSWLIAAVLLPFALGAIWMAPGMLSHWAASKVLLITPNRSYYPDFFPVKECLEEKGIRVVSAAETKRVAPVVAEQGKPFDTDTILSEVDLSEFDAVVFVGGHVGQLKPGGSAALEVERIIRDFRQSQKIVGGVCGGAWVLSEFLTDEMKEPSWQEGAVTIYDRMLTVPDPEAAEAFCNALGEMLENN